MNLNKKVSLFSSYMDAEPKEVNLLTFLTSNKYANEVKRIRESESKEERDALKSQLPAITPSGLFKERRAVKNLISHSGLIQIDIDAKDNIQHDMKALKELLKDIEQIVYCAYSVSGNGLFGLIPIKYPEKHKEHFLALEEDFKKDFDITIDKSCKDVSRLRGYSYDSEYYINENPLVYERLIELKPTVKPIVKKAYKKPISTTDNFYKALQIIESNHLDITGGNEQWFSILCAIANEYGEAGRGFAHLISQYSTLYDSKRCDEDFTRALNTKYSYRIGTFFHYLNNYIAC